MAIKGKGKTKPKQVTRGPKPTYVQVKPSLLMRKWVHVTAAFLVGIGAVLFTFWVVDSLRSSNREADLRSVRARERAAMSEVKARTDAALQPVGQAQPPSGFSYFPDLTKALDDFGKGKIGPGLLAKTAASAGGAAQGAQKTIEAIDATKILGGKGFPQLLIAYSLSAKARMSQALQLTQRAAEVVERAAKTPGGERRQLLVTAKGIQETASAVFADGYDDYVQAQVLAKMFVPTFGQPAPLPTG